MASLTKRCEAQALRLERARQIEREMKKLCILAGLKPSDDPNLALRTVYKPQLLALAREWHALQREFWEAPT